MALLLGRPLGPPRDVSTLGARRAVPRPHRPSRSAPFDAVDELARDGAQRLAERGGGWQQPRAAHLPQRVLVPPLASELVHGEWAGS
jgi:hypothetical protein